MSVSDSRIVDLHTHSICSDGTLTPSELLDYAVEKGLSALALTDHDTVEGLEELHAHASVTENAPEIVDGIEFSSEYNGKDIHIVGLFIDYSAPDFDKYLEEFRHSRDVRNEKMCKLLRDGLHMDISYEKLLEANPGAIITRAHYSKYMMEHGYTSNMKEAFERYIGEDKPFFVSREKITAIDAINLIHKTGGIAVLAHPTLYHMGYDKIHELVSHLKENSLDAMEILYTTFTPSQKRQMKELADEFDLMYSGGSDYHGAIKPRTDLATGWGDLSVPYEIYEKLKCFHESGYR